MTREEILVLENELDAILPDGMIDINSSYEALMGVFEDAWDRTNRIARKALQALKETIQPIYKQ